jgi:SAM-dependent methyltransferase
LHVRRLGATIRDASAKADTSGDPCMKENPPTHLLRATLDYYREHAGEFALRTRDIDMAALYDEFLPLVPPGGHILDAGCGVGRDSAAFLERGFQVTAFDASEAMVDMAAARIRRPVLHLSFQQLAFDHRFDGVWACASLLHVPRRDMAQVFSKLHDALVPGGVLYASFKRGPGEEFREGRLFNDYDEDTLSAFVKGQEGWAVVKVWRTEDIRQHRPEVQWVNILARATVER